MCIMRSTRKFAERSVQSLCPCRQPQFFWSTATEMASRKISLHLGTMTFGWSQSSSLVDDAVAQAFVQKFMDAGGATLDCARIYSGGESEKIVGRIMKTTGCRDAIQLVTKVHPSQPNGLSPDGIRAQLAASLEALQVSKVDVLYLHQPDTENALTNSLECVNALVGEGLVATYGLSNYSVVETERVLAICREKGYPLPSVYQGLYNAVNRRVETELIPLLRANGMNFVAYNPLAAGLLTGKHKPDVEVLQGRFKDNTNYMDRFYKPDHFQGLALIREACDKHSLVMASVAYRWLLSHSALADGDGLLLGASSVEQLEQNLSSCAAATEPLPDDVVAAFDEAWRICQPDAFAFWRGYSADQPGRADLDPGASYVVKK